MTLRPVGPGALSFPEALRAIDLPQLRFDLHATMLHCLGFDHRLLTMRFGGRDMRLTDVHGRVMREWLV
jgi:hypothetical protein